jgi:hypothetical protein
MNLFRRNTHLADATLLLLLEGDLRGRALRRAQRHLSTCSECRMRRFALMELNAQVSTGHPQVTATPAARDRLAAQLSNEVLRTESGGPARLLWLQTPTFFRVGAVVALLALAVAWRQFDLPLQDRMAAYEETGPEPNHALTPGSADPVALNELCGLSDTDLDPRLSPEIERAVFLAYGISERAARAYQVDYLINPQLGGNAHMENLWPEPYHATVWNARAKDALEARMHGMVCNGQIDLQAAQGELSSDWIAAYKKYFHTQRPVSTVAELDRPRIDVTPLP